MKKLFCVFLALVMCLSLAAPASASGYGRRSFAVDGGEVTVSFDAASVSKERIQIAQVGLDQMMDAEVTVVVVKPGSSVEVRSDAGDLWMFSILRPNEYGGGYYDGMMESGFASGLVDTWFREGKDWMIALEYDVDTMLPSLCVRLGAPERPRPDGQLGVSVSTWNGRTEAEIGGIFDPKAQGGLGDTAITADSAAFDLTSKSDHKSVSVTANIAKESARSMGDSGASMILRTDVADVTLDADAVSTMAEAGAEVTVRIDTLTVAGAEAAIEVSASADGRELLPENGQAHGRVTISVPTASADGRRFVYYVAGDDSAPVYVHKVDSSYADGRVTFTTDHLSRYVVTTAEQITAEVRYTVDAGGTAYGTLADALKDAPQNGTITLLRDVTLTGPAPLAVDEGRSLTLELNGRTVSHTYAAAGGSSLLTNRGELTIRDSVGGGRLTTTAESPDGKPWNYANSTITNSGTLTLESGIIENDTEGHGAFAIDAQGKARTTILGGAVIGRRTAVRQYAADTANANTLTISGGVIKGDRALWMQNVPSQGTGARAELVITRGEILGAQVALDTTTQGSSQTGMSVAISGGTFTGRVRFGGREQESGTEPNAQVGSQLLSITDGRFHGEVSVTNFSRAQTGVVSGGIFDVPPAQALAVDTAAEAVITGRDGSQVTAVGDASIDKVLKSFGSGATVDVIKGGLTLTDAPSDTKILTHLGTSAVIGGIVIRDGGTHIVDPTTPVQPVEPPVRPAGEPIRILSSANGFVRTDMSIAAPGAVVTIRVFPDEGYVFSALTVKDSSGRSIHVERTNSALTFVMPGTGVVIEAQFAPADDAWDSPFRDVAPGAYYYDAVAWALREGITGGVSETAFAPDAVCTRAEVVTLLWRAAGMPAPKTAEAPFGDVSADSYYYDAVLWACENGITNGVTESTFAPSAAVDRGQVVTLLHRAMGAPGELSVHTAFSDVRDDAYYCGAVSWAVAHGIAQGTGSSTFSPDTACTRAQTVTFLYRCMR